MSPQQQLPLQTLSSLGSIPPLSMQNIKMNDLLLSLNSIGASTALSPSKTPFLSIGPQQRNLIRAQDG